MDIIAQITSEFHLQAWQVENVVKLIDEGNTIPFIARYRKEAHGTLDDQMLREIAERLEYLRNLDKRREEVRASIEGQEKLTEEISAALSNAATLAEIEDIYRPFKPKRRTRASIAREKGLEPLAQVLYEQRPDCEEPLALALDFLNPEKGVETAEDALKGALRKIFRMMQRSAAGFAIFLPYAAWCAPNPPRRKTASMRLIMTSVRQWKKSQAIKCWQSTGENGRDF